LSKAKIWRALNWGNLSFVLVANLHQEFVGRNTVLLR